MEQKEIVTIIKAVATGMLRAVETMEEKQEAPDGETS